MSGQDQDQVDNIKQQMLDILRAQYTDGYTAGWMARHEQEMFKRFWLPIILGFLLGAATGAALL